MSQPITKRPPAGLLLRLSWRDLTHEWILTLCMILAIAAVLGPLLILMGLKHGTIQTLRDRLVEDPVNREIRPLQTERISTQWLAELTARSDVAFAIPTILRGSSIGRAQSPAGKALTIDLIPTTVGDPLLLENNGRIPDTDECVLSQPAAAELGIRTGEVLQLTISRTREQRREQETIPLRVAAILNDRATALPALYAPRQLVEDVEAYREGLAVSERGWPGGQPRPFVSFDGVRIIASQPLDSLTLRGLTINTGLVDLDTLDRRTVGQLGLTLPNNAVAYELRARGNTIQQPSLETLRAKLRGREAVLLPFTEQLAIFHADQPLHVIGLSLTDQDAEILGVPSLPWGALNANASDAHVRQILLPASLSVANEIVLRTTLLDEQQLYLPLAIVGVAPDSTAIVPVELLGMLRTGLLRHLEYLPDEGGLRLAKSGYRGFRLYARSIDDVPDLHSWFIGQGIAVQTMAQDIERVRILDRGLTRIFWLVAVVGIVGGMASLIANLYAAVERKKRDISVLRLMGFSRMQVFRFPIYQGVIMAVLSVAVAIFGYVILAFIINRAFATDLQLGQKICTLPPQYLVATFAITAAIALVSSLLAAWKTTRIDPAEALREE